MPQGVLDAYVEDGYVLLVDGLIPEDVVQRARDETWAVMGGSAPLVEGDPYQHLEQHGCSMAFAKHEAITIWCFWLLGVNAELLPIERCKQVNAGKAGA